MPTDDRSVRLAIGYGAPASASTSMMLTQSCPRSPPDATSEAMGIAYQRTNRRPHRSNTKPVPNNLIYRARAGSAGSRRCRSAARSPPGLRARSRSGEVARLPLAAPRDGGRPQPSPDRPVADEELGGPATKLVADPRIHRPDLGQRRPVEVNQACRPTGLSLGGNLLRHAVRGATGKSQMDTSNTSTCRLRDHARAPASTDDPVEAGRSTCMRASMMKASDRPSLYELAQIDRDRYTILAVDLSVDGPATVTIYAIDRIEHGVSGNAAIVELGERGGEIPVVQFDLAQPSVEDFIRQAFTRTSVRLITQTFRDQVLVVTESRPLSDLGA